MSVTPEMYDVAAGNESTWENLTQLKTVNPANTSVLLVDDDPDQLVYLSHLVSRAGYRVTAASNVRDALNLLVQRPFQILISDLKMPDMNGFEFLKAVRATERPDARRQIPVIVLTGAQGDVEFAAIEQGADMFCEKFRVQTLLPKQIQFLLEE